MTRTRSEFEGRPTCYRCHKAASVCVCAGIPTIDNRTEILVVQHPREQRHPIGSVRFARLGLSRARVVVAERGADGLLRAALDFPAGSALLFPTDEAHELDELGPRLRPTTLVLLDGTWSTVRRLLAGDPRLHRLPKVRITPRDPGRYRIRREPRPECISTLEATIAALRVLEPEHDAALDRLTAAFDRMIDRQVELARAHTLRRR